METSTAKQGTGKDVYTIITEKIIEQLENGTVPWQKSWNESGLPQNMLSLKPYRGINLILLASLGYEQNYFLTYKQLSEIGGKVKKDEKGHMVVYWSFPEKDIQTAENTETMPEAKKPAILRYYTVFNIAQCENIPDDKIPAAATIDFNPIPVCEHIVANMPLCPEIRHKEQNAYYDVLRDFINMPKQKSFVSEGAYYSTLFHEMVHSSGHHSRLSRKNLVEMTEYGSEPYSHEELVAEMGTCYLLSHADIANQFEQNTAYIQGWLWQLKNDKRLIFSAASQAQKAVDYILGEYTESDELKED